jgi:hypothetical protein
LVIRTACRAEGPAQNKPGRQAGKSENGKRSAEGAAQGLRDMDRNDFVRNDYKALIPTSRSGRLSVGASRLNALGSVATEF